MPGFLILKIDPMWIVSMCVYVCVCLCVCLSVCVCVCVCVCKCASIPKAINNWWRDVARYEPICLVLKVLQLLYGNCSQYC